MGLPAIIGVNIGQGQNHTAIADVYYNQWSYTILNITRLPLGSSFLELEDYLIKRIDILTMDDDYDVKVRVNATGIGTPVTNLLRKKISVIEDIYLTGGYKAEKLKDSLMLPKELMISHLKVLFVTDRILGSFDKPEPLMTRFEKQRFELFMGLKQELLDYETKVHVDVAHWNPEDRIGEFDDIAIALGLACWLSS